MVNAKKSQEEKMSNIEVRGFGELKKLFDSREWPFPLIVDLEEEISALDLAAKLNIPLEKIEIIFVNGKAMAIDCLIKPGDRVAFVPPGTPGPYRVILGFIKKDKQ